MTTPVTNGFMMIYEFNNYRSYLKSVLADKISSNPQYSLRSFAASLGISHAALSQVFKGVKNLSYERAMDIGAKLKLSESEQEFLCLLVQSETVKDTEKRSAIQDRMNRLRPSQKNHDLNLDIFRVISDWYHFPILSMTRLQNFNFSSEAIADRLGISVIEASVAMERLLRLELLEKNEAGKWVEAKSYLMISSETPSSAMRKFHRQMLEKAMDSIEGQQAKNKVNGSETFAIHPCRLDEAREISERYFNEMVELSEKSQKKEGATDIYHLQVNFFNLTAKKESKYENEI